MLTKEQIAIINGLSSHIEVQEKMTYISAYYDGQDKEELLSALEKHLQVINSPKIALTQFNESQSEMYQNIKSSIA
jgi:hypothetical protein